MADARKEKVTVIGKKELVGAIRQRGFAFDAIVYNSEDFHTPPLERVPFTVRVGEVLTKDALKPAMAKAREMRLIPDAKPVVAVRYLSTKLYPHLAQKK